MIIAAVLPLLALTQQFGPVPGRPKSDWLVDSTPYRARMAESGEHLAITNGLISRTFRIDGVVATVGMDNLMTGEAMLRAVKPEMIIELNGEQVPFGGLTGQPDHAYLRPEWIDKMAVPVGPYTQGGMAFHPTTQRFSWKRNPGSNGSWPPRGIDLSFSFNGTGKWRGIVAEVHYELYDGIPLMSKWIVVKNLSSKAVRVTKFTSEILAVVERESVVDAVSRWELPNITVFSDYSFGGMSASNSTHTTEWAEDPEYTTQVNYERKTPALLLSHPPIGPDAEIAPGASFTSYRTYELFHDSDDRERKGLAIRKSMRLLAPWVADNPLMMHLTTTNTTAVKRAIDQCAEVGFEMVIFSFGSGLNMEDVSPANIARFKEFVTYAHSKGLRIGGYSLLASRRINDDEDVINPKTGKTGGAIFGNSPCLCSKWGEEYFAHIKTFLSETGFDLLEHDGSYPGDVCASTKHPGHRGLEDSQWKQFEAISEFYHWCRGRNIYLNVPDFYFLNGSNKTGMGYRESNWSLPRAEQHIHARQNIFDGTWDKAPSMGWMFTPLVEYQGGGKAATIEPLKDHLVDYGLHLANNLGAGVQSCYRGPRLYDSPETRDLVIKWVKFYKTHRAILEADVVHLRRADGREMDGLLHVDPKGKEKGLAVFYNPTNKPLTKSWMLPIYYTGLSDTASVEFADGKKQTVKLARDYSIPVTVTCPANGMTWVVIR
ncbi:MAG: alpha-galactosidase [Chthonomonadales bacterium]